MIKRNGIVLHPLVLMTGTRYFSYGLNILRGLIIARLLGPYYFGVWGLITLALQYLSFTSLGLENSITVVLSTDRGKSNDNEGKYSSSAIISILTLGIGVLLIAYGLKSSKLVSAAN